MRRDNKTLVFTVALNGYQYLYEANLDTHRHYAERNGYEYVAVTKPCISLLGLECAWLKISLLARALSNGYETVLYLDADACISPLAPSLDSLNMSGKYLYMALGHSGRFNSGVMLTRKHAQIIADLEQLVESSPREIAEPDRVGWGENGHVIAYARNNNLVQEISCKWNNNADPQMEDYIRHFSMGPMRPLYRAKLKNRAIFFAFRCLIALGKRVCRPHRENFIQRINKLTLCCSHRYKQFKSYP